MYTSFSFLRLLIIFVFFSYFSIQFFLYLWSHKKKNNPEMFKYRYTQRSPEMFLYSRYRHEGLRLFHVLFHTSHLQSIPVLYLCLIMTSLCLTGTKTSPVLCWLQWQWCLHCFGSQKTTRGTYRIWLLCEGKSSTYKYCNWCCYYKTETCQNCIGADARWFTGLFCFLPTSHLSPQNAVLPGTWSCFVQMTSRPGPAGLQPCAC